MIAMRRAAKALRVLLLAALCACGEGSGSTLIMVTISGVPEGTRTLRATSYLDDRREQDPADLDGNEHQLVVRMPPGKRGSYRLEIDALGDDGCSFAQGDAQLTLLGQPRIELRVTLTSRGGPSCTLAVRKEGPGVGYVESDVANIRCGTIEDRELVKCFAQIQREVRVTLTARPSRRASFDGWSGDCIGRDTCEVIMDRPRTVTATFGVRAQE